MHGGVLTLVRTNFKSMRYNQTHVPIQYIRTMRSTLRYFPIEIVCAFWYIYEIYTCIVYEMHIFDIIATEFFL